ncbi:AraC family transcriptional regulator [Actinocatenispora thailandica]|uniref:AraC family transcriptional regulator n=1 Tax=Actinocatenispora thailandica TaxID=227318 RepID=A0A7R7DPA7_9ACTN|nr:helix-turn-helix domain-containing protein [Actinocatenispora thailandica]BCJ35150.1 AraC family transcriptional regulator [Actinocatenispora thailandica]
MHRLAVVAVPPVTSFELSIPDIVFGQARAGAEPAYEVVCCTADPGPVPGIGGVGLTVDRGLDALAGAATVLVIGGADLAPPAAPVVAALRAARAAGARLVAPSCAGAFLLAGCGLLAGHRAAVGPQLAERFRRRHPDVTVSETLYVADAGVYTCAGHAASIDLCLHLVGADHGAAVAGAIARALAVSPPRPAEAAPPAEPVAPPPAVSLASTREWMLARLGEPVALAELARHANTSVRTLTRRFRAETGSSPLRWLLARRLDEARRLLETTDLSVDAVARRAGLGTADSLRAHFARELGRTPSSYRAGHRAG